MSADKLSRLVAAEAEKVAAPIPADMEHLNVDRLDGGKSYAYFVGGVLSWERDDSPVPHGARPLYVKAV